MSRKVFPCKIENYYDTYIFEINGEYDLFDFTTKIFMKIRDGYITIVYELGCDLSGGNRVIGTSIGKANIDKDLFRLLCCVLIETIFEDKEYEEKKIERELFPIISLQDRESTAISKEELAEFIEDSRGKCAARGIELTEAGEFMYTGIGKSRVKECRIILEED